MNLNQNSKQLNTGNQGKVRENMFKQVMIGHLKDVWVGGCATLPRSSNPDPVQEEIHSFCNPV